MLPDQGDWQWGTWVLGDLPTVLRRASDVLGHSSDVVCVVVEPPGASDDFPTITVVVPSERTVRRLRAAVADGGWLVWFGDDSTRGRWTADVVGLHLVVTNEGP